MATNSTRIILLGALCLSLISACSSVPESKRVELRCQSSVLAHERIACFKTFIQESLTRKISTATKQLTSSDWPFDYLIRVDISLSPQGDITSVAMLKESTSRHLNNKIVQAIKSMKQLTVPKKALYTQGGFGSLKLLIKPARKSILGAEKTLPADIMPIMLPGPCATRSRQC